MSPSSSPFYHPVAHKRFATLKWVLPARKVLAPLALEGGVRNHLCGCGPRILTCGWLTKIKLWTSKSKPKMAHRRYAALRFATWEPAASQKVCCFGTAPDSSKFCNPLAHTGHATLEWVLPAKFIGGWVGSHAIRGELGACAGSKSSNMRVQGLRFPFPFPFPLPVAFSVPPGLPSSLPFPFLPPSETRNLPEFA